MSQRWDRLTTGILTLAAVAIAVVVVRREFFDDAAANRESRTPQYVEEWKDVLRWGRSINSTDAPIRIVEFVDLQCPFCEKFHNGTLRRVLDRFPDKVSVTYVHYLIPSHRHAEPAARAAECAGEHGRFAEFVHAVFEKQDSLGVKSWESYAADAGLRDNSVVTRCALPAVAASRIDSGTAVGERIGVRGTPGVMVNGWLFPRPPSDSVLVRTIDALLKGEKPNAQRAWLRGG
jgi:protein-disulfide isomerase